MLKPHGRNVLFDVAKQIAPRVVMFLPRNVNLGQLADLALSTTPPWTLEQRGRILLGISERLELQEMTLEKNTREAYFTLLNFGEKAMEEIQ
ncbi:RNA cap guanine-N2 methyltransferase [Tanacetum coccineum]